MTPELFLLLGTPKVKKSKRVQGPGCCSEGLGDSGDSTVPGSETQMLEVDAQGFSESCGPSLLGAELFEMGSFTLRP